MAFVHVTLERTAVCSLPTLALQCKKERLLGIVLFLIYICKLYFEYSVQWKDTIFKYSILREKDNFNGAPRQIFLGEKEGLRHLEGFCHSISQISPKYMKISN